MGKEAKYIVRLTDEERHTLQQLVVGPRVARDKALRARMLLKADVDGPHWRDGQIAEAFDVGVSTIHRLRQRLVEDGLGGGPDPPTARPHEATQTRRRAGSPSRGHRVQPGAGGARVLDAAPAGGASWSNSRWWRPSGGKPCGKRSKK